MFRLKQNYKCFEGGEARSFYTYRLYIDCYRIKVFKNIMYNLESLLSRCYLSKNSNNCANLWLEYLIRKDGFGEKCSSYPNEDERRYKSAYESINEQVDNEVAGEIIMRYGNYLANKELDKKYIFKSLRNKLDDSARLRKPFVREALGLNNLRALEIVSTDYRRSYSPYFSKHISFIEDIDDMWREEAEKLILKLNNNLNFYDDNTLVDNYLIYSNLATISDRLFYLGGYNYLTYCKITPEAFDNIRLQRFLGIRFPFYEKTEDKINEIKKVYSNDVMIELPKTEPGIQTFVEKFRSNNKIAEIYG